MRPDIGIGRGRDQIDDVGDVRIDFEAEQVRAAVDRLDVAAGILVPPRSEDIGAVGLRAVGPGALKRIGEDRLQILAGLEQQLVARRSEEHTSELQSLMRISYAVFCLKKKK